MPIEAEWDESRSLWRITVGEAFTMEELAGLIEKSEWRGARRFLWDLREVRMGPDSSAEIRQAASGVGDATQFDGARVAAVVARDLDFGTGRMFGVYVERSGIRFELFRDIETAIDWLCSPG